MIKQTKAIVLSGLNVLALLTAATPATAKVETVGAPIEQPNHQTDLNQQSLSSIESSFLDIPRVCKARNAAFDPTSTKGERISSATEAIFAQTIG